jgi:RNA polymerase sigma factor (sigma-70 family)
MTAADRDFAHLMERLRSGDRDAAAEVVARFNERLKALAARKLDPRVRAKVDPEDVTQAAFEDFFRRWSAGEFRLTGWDGLWAMFAVIVVRRCAWEGRRYTAARRDVRREVPDMNRGAEAPGWLDELATPQAAPDQAVLVAETMDRVLGELDESDREVVRLALLGQTVAEISGRVGRTPRTVYRVLDRIRGLLGESAERTPA